VGEHTMIPCAPLVANAIADAVGVRVTSMPITAERLFLVLEGRPDPLHREFGSQM
jgi:CO/xanthine dehydrogenase Mo-binding subunit